MWKMLKADFNYNKGGLIIFFGIGVILLLMSVIWEFFEFFVFVGIMTMLFWIIMAMIGAEEDKENRERMQALLPVPIKRFEIGRLLFVVITQTVMFLLWVILLFTTRPMEIGPAFRDILCINALIFIVIMIFVIFHDLKYSRCKRCRFIFLGGIFGILILFGYFHYLEIMQYPLNFNSSYPKTPLETLIFQAVCLGLFCWDFQIFIHRKSYIS